MIKSGVNTAVRLNPFGGEYQADIWECAGNLYDFEKEYIDDFVAAKRYKITENYDNRIEEKLHVKRFTEFVLEEYHLTHYGNIDALIHNTEKGYRGFYIETIRLEDGVEITFIKKDDPQVLVQ